MTNIATRATAPVRREIMLYVKITLGVLIFSLPLSLPPFLDFVRGLPAPSVIDYGGETKPHVWASYQQAFKQMLFLCIAPALLITFLRLIFCDFFVKDEQKRNAIYSVGLVLAVIFWTLSLTGAFQ